MRLLRGSVVSGLGRKLAIPGLFASAFLVANPTSVSFQDISTILTGSDSADARWKTHMLRAGAGSIHEAKVQFGVDPIVTGATGAPGSVAGAGLGKVAIGQSKSVAPDTPDEARINRSGKTGRLVSIAPTAPPKAFSAGSVLERQSNLLRPGFDDRTTMVFTKKGDQNEALKIASAFHVKSKKPPVSPGVPVMLASLVTNDTPDILATAYAPPAPDFARQSPFESLLKEDKPKSGRFIPPVSKKDHAWARKPLPAHAFSKKEQKCLAEGIYFEARGESLKGQAAVSQVILNRVRNPTFPNTICGVVYQNIHWRNRCQFSFACDGKRDRINSKRHWNNAKEVAMATTAGKIWLDEVGSSTHYHATYVRPRWARSMKRMERIGLHIFYRTYGGGWS